ncbi:MAG: hypothetical protein LBN05_07365 [Oscillospiraceae bacterium]|jgi:hypothetical protein|nr:hypothetical protein [Oscillospiraceae bacterium]
MKKTLHGAQRVLALLLIFGLLFGVGSAVYAEEPPAENIPPIGTVVDDLTDGDYELTDSFAAILKWLGDNFGPQIADFATKVIIKAGLILAKIGVKLVLKPIAKKAISNAIQDQLAGLLN